MSTVVITGGSRGIGAAAVQLFAERGDRVYFLYEKNHDAARVLGELLRMQTEPIMILAAIGKERQVLCVTHLQQIAALADCHYLVEKAFDGSRTRTQLSVLEGERRVSEIARMLGGEEESAKVHAREMLKEEGKQS